MYGTHLWSEYSKTGYDRIRIVYNDFFRKLFGIKGGGSISAAFVNAHGQLQKEICVQFYS